MTSPKTEQNDESSRPWDPN